MLTGGADLPADLAADLAALAVIADVVADPWDETADAVVRRAREARAAGAAGFRFTGPPDRPAVLTRLDLAERVRTEGGGLIVVDAPRGLRDDVRGRAGQRPGRPDLLHRGGMMSVKSASGTSRWGDRVVRYPDDLVRRYRQAGLWGTRTIADEFHAVAVAHPDRDAVVALDGRLTFRQLDERSDRLAAGLAGLGLVPGDPVPFQVTNRLGSVLAWYGVLKAGLVPVCTLAAHRGHEIGGISRKVGAVAHLVEAGTGSFDLVAFAAEQQRDHPTLRHVLVLGGESPGLGTPASRWSRSARGPIRGWPANWSRRSSARSTRTRWPCSSCPAAPRACPR